MWNHVIIEEYSLRGDRLIHPNLNSHISIDLFSIDTIAFHGAYEWDQLFVQSDI